MVAVDQSSPETREESYVLLDLAEKAVTSSDLIEFTSTALPRMTEVTLSGSSFLYLDDPRLLSPQMFSHQIADEYVPDLNAFCIDQFDWYAKEESQYPLIVSASWYEGERVHLYPLFGDEGPFGIVGFISQQKYISGRKALWVRFIKLFSNIINSLIERHQSDRQLAHLNTYLNVSSMLSQPLGLHEILEAVLFCSMEVVTAEASSVLLLDDDAQNFLFYQAEGPAKPSLEAITFPTDKGIAGSVFHSQKGEIINDVDNDPRFFGHVDTETGFRTRNMIALPLTAGEEKIGILEVINKLDGDAFTEDELLLLLSIADEIAFAIRNARIFEYVVNSYCFQRQGLATCRGCKRPLGSWTPCVKYREKLD